MPETLTRQRCFNHFGREAVARCPECGRFFCRECITEHEDRVVCAACLARLTEAPEKRLVRWAALSQAAQLGASALILWLFFYLAGQSLAALPASFHEGTVWKVAPWEKEQNP